MKEQNETQKRRGRPVTHDEANEAALRLIRSHFNREGGARCSIPADPMDDDLLLCDYIREQRSGRAVIPEPTLVDCAAKNPFPVGQRSDDFIMGWQACTAWLRNPRPKQDADAPIRHLFWAAEDGSMNEADKSANDCIREAYQIGLRAADREAR